MIILSTVMEVLFRKTWLMSNQPKLHNKLFRCHNLLHEILEWMLKRLGLLIQIKNQNLKKSIFTGKKQFFLIDLINYMLGN